MVWLLIRLDFRFLFHIALFQLSITPHLYLNLFKPQLRLRTNLTWDFTKLLQIIGWRTMVTGTPTRTLGPRYTGSLEGTGLVQRRPLMSRNLSTLSPIRVLNWPAVTLQLLRPLLRLSQAQQQRLMALLQQRQQGRKPQRCSSQKQRPKLTLKTWPRWPRLRARAWCQSPLQTPSLTSPTATTPRWLPQDPQFPFHVIQILTYQLNSTDY